MLLVIVAIAVVIANYNVIVIFLGLRALAVARCCFSHHSAQLPTLQHWAPPVTSQQVFI